MSANTPNSKQSGSKKAESPRRPQLVFTLLVELGRKAGDGLPDGASGAAMLCYASGVDEAEAVRETVAVLKQAGLNPLDVTGYGTREERVAMGHDIGTEELTLMARALSEHAVIVAQMTPFFGDDEAGDVIGDIAPGGAGTR